MPRPFTGAGINERANSMKKRTVAIVGFAHTTLQFAKFSEADEMWSVNFAWRYDVPRIDRLFEIHPIEVLAYNAQIGDPANEDNKHYEWLQKKHDFPIYTWADYTGENIMDTITDDKPRIPNSVPYPFEILDGIFENFNRENRPGQVYMPSTISYMLALAIHEGFERIEMYGIEMATDSGGANGTEYVYQKAGTEALLMYAMGKGIEVWLPEHCKLMNIKPYHEGLQMITRQTVESMKKTYEQKRLNAISETNFFRGKIDSGEKKWEQKRKTLQHNFANRIKKAEKNKASKSDLKEIEARFEEDSKMLATESEAEMMPLIKAASNQQALAYMAHGNEQLCTHLINTIDYDNPLVELINQFSSHDPTQSLEPEIEKEKVLA